MIKHKQLTTPYQRPDCAEVGFGSLGGVCLVAASANGSTEPLDDLVDFDDYLNS